MEYDAIPEEERKQLAQQVADKVLSDLVIRAKRNKNLGKTKEAKTKSR